MDPIGQDILSRVKNNRNYEHAIIAGGYVRDMVLGGKFKDVDIFIPDYKRSSGSFDKIDDLFEFIESDSLFKFKEVLSKNNSNYDSDFLVISATFREVIPVQFMLTKIGPDNFVEDLFKTFDFDLCKCYYNGEKQIITPEAERDIYSNTATLSYVKDMNAFSKSMTRFASWKIKYPNLKFKTNYILTTREEQRKRDENIKRYYEEYYRNPAKVGTYSFDPLSYKRPAPIATSWIKTGTTEGPEVNWQALWQAIPNNNGGAGPNA